MLYSSGARCDTHTNEEAAGCIKYLNVVLRFMQVERSPEFHFLEEFSEDLGRSFFFGIMGGRLDRENMESRPTVSVKFLWPP